MVRAHAPFGEPSYEQHTIVDPDTWAVTCDEHGELDDGSTYSSEAEAWEDATSHDRLHAEGAFAPQPHGGTPLTDSDTERTDRFEAQAEVDTPADPEREFWDDFALRYCDPATGEVMYEDAPQ